jgi:hypothetical protein
LLPYLLLIPTREKFFRHSIKKWSPGDEKGR